MTTDVDAISKQVFHIEDDAVDWRDIPYVIRNLVRELLDDADDKLSAKTVALASKEEEVSIFKVSWKNNSLDYSLDYYFLTGADLAKVEDKLEAGAFFIVDAMRANRQGNMESNLRVSLNSIAPHLNCCDTQLRIFSAYEAAKEEVKHLTDIENVNKVPIVISKSNVEKLHSFLLGGMGFDG